MAAQRRWSVIELLSTTWIAGSPSIHSFSKILSKNHIDEVNFSSPIRDFKEISISYFLDTSATCKSHEHLTWPYPPSFPAFVSIMNFPMNNNRKNLTLLLIYIIPTSVLSIYICGSSAGTIRAVPDTELKVPGFAPVLIAFFIIDYVLVFHTYIPKKKLNSSKWTGMNRMRLFFRKWC